MSNQTKCSRCGDWIDAGWDHDFQHLEERKVEALERIAAALDRQELQAFAIPDGVVLPEPNT